MQERWYSQSIFQRQDLHQTHATILSWRPSSRLSGEYATASLIYPALYRCGNDASGSGSLAGPSDGVTQCYDSSGKSQEWSGGRRIYIYILESSFIS